MSELEDSFKSYGVKTFKAQLEILEPHMVIFDSTFEIVNKNLNLIDKTDGLKHNSLTSPYLKDDVLYLDCYHPSARIPKATYCNEIISSFNLLKA